MDDLLKQIAGSDPAMMADLLKQINGGVDGAKEAELAEDEKMENAYMTYQVFIQNQLKYTSHSVEWLPISHEDAENPKFNVHYFLLGTHKEQIEDAPPVGNDQVQLFKLRVPNAPMPQSDLENLLSKQKDLSRLELVTQFDHQNEVIKARAMPQKLSVVASMTNSGAINIYNIPEISDIQTGTQGKQHNDVVRLGQQLEGLQDESFALSWNRSKEGMLCSAAQQLICVWDVNKQSTPSTQLENAHVDSINDVRFSPNPAHGGNLMISTADDGHFKVWDLRLNEGQQFTMTYKAAEDSLCVGAFNPINEHLFAVAGEASGNISIWDMRMPADAINHFIHHSSQVTVLEWSPTNEFILASGADDAKINIWDQSNAGQEQGRGDYEDGPPDMVFPHEYHSSNIEDFIWIHDEKTSQKPMICSIETNCCMQIWQMSDEFTDKEIDHYHLLDKIALDELE